MSSKMFPNVPFMGQRLTCQSLADFGETVLHSAKSSQQPIRIGYLNAATTNLCLDDPQIGTLFDQFDCLYADGQAVVWASRFLGHPVPERINAADFMLQFLTRCAAEGLSIGLIGGRGETPGQPESEAQRFAQHFSSLIPSLKITSVRHGYFGPADEEQILRELAVADPDIVLLGMGTPRQERIALEWSARAGGRPRVWWCVGALFEYFSGTRYRAPRWVRRIGMEWAVRLVLEPGRLWRRYILGNPRFVWRVWRARRKVTAATSPPPNR